MAKSKRNKSAPTGETHAQAHSATTQSGPLQTISAREFAGRFANGVRVSQQSFTWFLGAGCSKTSGIMDAAGLTEKWLKEQFDLEAIPKNTFDVWVKSNFPAYDPANPAALYAKAFGRRHPSPVERQREIEMICARGEPAYGYATLAQMLSHGDYGRYCNTVLTTNFDDLIADALYLYGERHARPLVVTHEALVRYVRTNSPRPTIVKLHGDAHLDPKNLEPETRELDDALCKQLYPFLQDHALIFIGYGGNDQSILKFVQNCPVPALAPPIYWISKREPPLPFRDWLRERNALRVDHTDFDQLMHLIRNALNIELIDPKRWNQIGDRYYEAFERLRESIERLTTCPAADSDDAVALKIATSEAEKTLPDDWSYVQRARAFIDLEPDKADEIFLEGLHNYPHSRTLNHNYAVFLNEVRKDADGAEKFFKTAIEADPTNSATLGRYALFLNSVRGDPDAAEIYYRRSVDADPASGYVQASYAIFMWEVRSAMDVAELHFKRAVDAEPNYRIALVHYARFLQHARADMDAAESYYKRAIKAEPSDPYALCMYALFLQNVRKDMDAAETYFKQNIILNPKYSWGLDYYGTFLQHVRGDMAAAKANFKRAMEANPKIDLFRSHYEAFLEAKKASGS